MMNTIVTGIMNDGEICNNFMPKNMNMPKNIIPIKIMPPNKPYSNAFPIPFLIMLNYLNSFFFNFYS